MATEKEKHTWGNCIIALFALVTVFPAWCFLVYSVLMSIEPTTQMIVAFWVYAIMSVPLKLIGILWNLVKPD